jgi:hypothetical protein
MTGIRRIINGVAYDTETSTLIVRGDHDHEMSQAWWAPIERDTVRSLKYMPVMMV